MVRSHGLKPVFFTVKFVLASCHSDGGRRVTHKTAVDFDVGSIGRG
jgi:hypothetical protein